MITCICGRTTESDEDRAMVEGWRRIRDGAGAVTWFCPGESEDTVRRRLREAHAGTREGRVVE